MRTKSSTTPSAAQEALLTTASHFHNFDSSDKSAWLLQVLPGMAASEALSSSSNLLGSVTEILDRLLDGGMSGNEIYGIRFMVDAAKAFVDSTTRSVEFGNRQGGEA